MAKKSNRVKQEPTIDDIIDEIKQKSADGDYIYRGERKRHKKISSAFYRDYFEGKGINIDIEDFDLIIAEKEMLRTVKNHIGEPPKASLENFVNFETRKLNEIVLIETLQRSMAIDEESEELEILTELQHYGGKTNLIDFTTDYLIALFFACSGSPKNVGRIILLEKDEKAEKMIIRPQNPRHRVLSQKSIFLHPPKGYIEVPENNIVFIRTKFKQPMLEYLRKYHDISAETIYNDIHGFIINQNIHKSAYIEFYQAFTFQNKGRDATNPKERKELYETAIRHYDSAIELNPEESGLYNNRGECRLHLGEWDLARKDLKIAFYMGSNIIHSFQNDYEDVAEFEKKTDLTMPPDLAEMLGG